MQDIERLFRLCSQCTKCGLRSCLGNCDVPNEYNARCCYCTATNPINAERCCACARQNWRRP